MLRRSLLAVVLVLTPALRAQDAPPTTPAEKTVIQASDKPALDAHIGKHVTVEGTVSEAAWSGTGKVMNVRFADTRESGFVAALFKDNRDYFDKVFDNDTAKALTGAKIQVSGKLSTYRDKPQIILTKPAQVKILSKPDDKPKD